MKAVDQRLRPARIPDALYSACGYFLPRLMFLPSAHAGQVHWGDVTVALRDFPGDAFDLRSPEFWREWMRRWTELAQKHASHAQRSTTAAGRKQANRSAAGCYHWAEFMYFDDAAAKTELRRSARDAFRASLESGGLTIEWGELSWEDRPVSYYLLLPERRGGSGAPVPCVVMSNGLDSMTEVELVAFAEQFVARGMAALLFEGPGQGLQVGIHPIDVRIEELVGQLVTKLGRDGRIDCERLAFFGISFGGYLALRVATRAARFFRCVVNVSGGAELAPFERLPRRLKDDFRFVFKSAPGEDMQPVFDSLRIPPVASLDTKLLTIHGALDDIFPLAPLAECLRAVGRASDLRVFKSEAHVCLNYVNQYAVDIGDWAAGHLFG